MRSVPSRSAAMESYGVVELPIHVVTDGKFRPLDFGGDMFRPVQKRTVSLFLSPGLSSHSAW